MIVPMKKVSVIFDTSDSDDTLRALREYGEFHPSSMPTPPPDNEWFWAAGKRICVYEKAMSICSFFQGRICKNKTGHNEFNDILSISERIIETHAKLENLEKEILRYEKEFEAAKPWGKTDCDAINALARKGVIIKFFGCTARDLEKIPANLALFEVFRQKQKIVAGFIPDKNSPFDIFPEIHPPSKSPAILHDVIEKLGNEILNLENGLNDLCSFMERINEEHEILEMEIEFERVKSGITDKGRTGILSGFCPEESLGNLKKTANEKSWAILIETPSLDDPVPTLARHSFLPGLFRPVMDFMGLVPSYHEPDTNLAFLVFFTFFSALLAGDAGYGTIMLSGALLAGIIDKKIKKETLWLLYLLSTATIIWGAVTGMWFGSEKIAQIPLIKSMIIPDLYAFSEKSDAFVTEICLVTAFCHLSLAHAWKGFRLFPDLESIAETGWIAVLFGVYKTAGAMLQGHKVTPDAWIYISCGAVSVILFGNSGKGGITKNILSGLSAIPENLLSGIGCFSDSISYIRLFAVGLATREMAKAFNNLASGTGHDSFFSAFMAVMILLSGHTVNILLACMSVMVHGTRLNLLEFSGHLGMEWAGMEYRPFRTTHHAKA